MSGTPSTFSGITVGTDLIGKTLTFSTNTYTLSPQGKRIFDFNNSNNSAIQATAAIFGPFRSVNNRFSLSFKESTGSIQTTETTFVTRTALYIYTIYFISLTQIQYKIYNWTDTSSPLSTITLTIPSTILPSINTFWFGKSSLVSVANNNASYERICLFDGDVTDPEATLPWLVSDFPGNTWTTTRFLFGPLNNLKGVIVDYYDDAAVGVWDITLEGGYMNMIGVFTIAPPQAPTIGSAVYGGMGQANVTWSGPQNNGATPILRYSIISNPGNYERVIIGPTVTSGIITGLPAGNYTFQVMATNEVGNSPLSNQTSVVVINFGSNGPTAVLNNQVVNLSWNVWIDYYGNDAYYYLLNIFQLNIGLIGTNTIYNTYTTISGLANNNSYYFKLRAFDFNSLNLIL